MDNSLVRSGTSTVRPAGADQSGRTKSAFLSARLQPRREDACYQIKGCIRARRRHSFHSSILESLSCVHGEYDSISNPACQLEKPKQDSCPFDGYIQACSQIVLLPGSLTTLGTAYSSLTWDMVARVICIVTDGLTCPICLETPIAPRMERCGHIYCFPCAIQYVSHENKNSHKKCAVCAWVINLKEMKRVTLRFADPPKVGALVEMVLMLKKSDGSIVRFDHSGSVEKSDFRGKHSFLYEQSDGECFEVEEELNSLLAFNVECADHPCFPELTPSINKSIQVVSQEISELRMNRVHTPHVINEDTLTGVEDEVMFYQASDGLSTYLDGLMWKCFLAEYSSPRSMPPVVNLKVLSVKNLIVTEYTQKRWRYLSHLPLGHSFCLLEVDLCPPVISNVTIECFKDALEKRHISRNRELLEDLRLTQLKEAAENRIPSLRDGFRLSGHAELSDTPASNFASVDSDDFVALCPPNEPHLLPSTSFSFAEVTKCGASSVVDRNRIANFSRTPRNRSNSNTFDFAAENWPSLGEATASGESSSIGCHKSTSTLTSTPRLDTKPDPHKSCEEPDVQSGQRLKRKRHKR